MTINTKNIIQSIGERARIAADKLVNINGDIKNIFHAAEIYEGLS